MTLFWFLAGVLLTLALLAALSSWLRTSSRIATLTATPSRTAVIVLLLSAMVGALYLGIGRPHAESTTPFGAAAKALANAEHNESSSPGDSTAAMQTKPIATAARSAAGQASAGPMDAAVANLSARLARGGGSAGDWELLAKSFEFLGRPADAAEARAHRLAAVAGSNSSVAVGSATAAGQNGAVRGEVDLNARLRSKAARGETLFIIAKSVDSPGAPVAVLRTTVGEWPVQFTLDDSLSMMPGRALSTAGRVTVEARISRAGQPLPASGDLQGSSGVLDPGDRKPLTVVIDREIP